MVETMNHFSKKGSPEASNASMRQDFEINGQTFPILSPVTIETGYTRNDAHLLGDHDYKARPPTTCLKFADLQKLS